jgi:hypothetical protein
VRKKTTAPDAILAGLLRSGQRLDEKVRGDVTERLRRIDELLMIRDKQGRLVKLLPNRAQREYEDKRPQRAIVLKARQLGISTWIAARFFIATITRPGTVSVQVAHDLAAAQQIFRIVHRFVANLPEDVRKGALETSRANVRQLVFARLDSEYRVETAADREAGRGLTITNLHCSEVARWPGNAAETLAGLRAAVAPQGEIVLESTPNGAAGCFYDEWQRADETGYHRFFFPWWYEDAYRLDPRRLGKLTEDEQELVARAGLTRAQIAFRRSTWANFRGLAPQEYAEDPESCFRASGECVFDLEMFDRRRRELSVPMEESDNGRLRVWYPPLPGRQYILGVDPAGGGPAGDATCAQVIDRSTGLQCAELHGHLPPGEAARRVAKLAARYNRALVAVERNNHGHAVLMALGQIEQYPRLYERKGLGWETNAATRPLMLEHLVALFTCAPQLFTSDRLLAEFRTFVRRHDGSPAAAPGAHDDCVFAMAIAQQVRTESAPPRCSETGTRWEKPEPVAS